LSCSEISLTARRGREWKASSLRHLQGDSRDHAVYWPAFLMSAGIEVPRRIFSHGYASSSV
jgi:methionyl-tRNA synthetase